MPRRKKKSQAYAWGDTPEIQALGAGFARQGYYNSGYEKARIFANKTTSSSLAARIKPDGTYAPARFAYATGVKEPDLGGQFAVGTSASGLASDLKFKDARALQTAFNKSSKNPVHGIDLSMPETQLAVLRGTPVFKFKEVSAVAAPPAAEAFAAIHTQLTTTPIKHPNPPQAPPAAVVVSPAAKALVVLQTQSAALQTRSAAKRALNGWNFEAVYATK